MITSSKCGIKRTNRYICILRQILGWYELAAIPRLQYSLILWQFYTPGFSFSMQNINGIKSSYVSCSFIKTFSCLQLVLSNLYRTTESLQCFWFQGPEVCVNPCTSCLDASEGLVPAWGPGWERNIEIGRF